VIQGPSSQDDLRHNIDGNSGLNLHEEVLYVMRKDNHYDAIFASGAENERCNAAYLNGVAGDDSDFNNVIDPPVEG
jgi:hypothetical protein